VASPCVGKVIHFAVAKIALDRLGLILRRRYVAVEAVLMHWQRYPRQSRCCAIMVFVSVAYIGDGPVAWWRRPTTDSE